MRYAFKSVILLLLAVSAYFTSFSQAAKKHDVILKLNGDELTGDVLEISDSTVRFTYTGEKLVYNLKKSEIRKITFASGRVETINAPVAAAPAATTTAPVQVSAEERRNKVAVLPFSFLKDGQAASPEMSEEVQNELYALLSKHAGVYTIVSPRATNVALTKAGISRANMLNYTMAEICQTLGVEFIIDGMITQNRTTQTSYGNTTYSDKTKKDNSDDKKNSGYASSSSTSVQNYETTMDMKIYNDKSEVIYNQNRKAFWNTGDAYKNTMEYLVKRCPLYTK
ncbi:hypothetical protein [Chitinophaga arvensicola]|uniref:Uncharacterized protein n=1 Tax=Chitinophaga arvensicola TaxID=29529 RepID=A0A1I0RTH4_9BACT|nr:hypothetical protein [Chitinophaga arvensicola]SEW44498.1 hypothetical protein SAMN04488122_3338 [Chitinophaga arvensicola]